MVDFSATYAGVNLKNPLIGASGPTTHTPETCEKHAQAGWGAVILKTCHAEMPKWLAKKQGSPMWRLYDFAGRETWRPIPPPKKSAPKVWGKKGTKWPPYALGYISNTDPALYEDPEYIEFYNETKKRCDPYDCKVIPSLYAITLEGWGQLCKMVNRMKPLPPAVELCLSIPISWLGGKLEGLGRGLSPANEPDVCERITKFCVDHLDVPVISKLAPLELRNGDVALAVQRAGAKGINIGNIWMGPSLRIDIETATVGGHPDFPIAGESPWGPWVIPYNCGAIYQMRSLGVTIDIAALGGVHEVQDIIRYVMSGANVVQACGAVQTEGFVIGSEWLEGLSLWMERKGYRSIEEMRGIIIDKVLTDRTKLPLRVPQILGGPPPPLEIVLNEERCIDCGWCEKCCMYLAIEIVGERPRIDKNKCEVCGLCEAICPVHAITMQSAR